MLRKLMIVFTAAIAIGIATFPTNASAQWHGGWHGGGWHGGGWGWASVQDFSAVQSSAAH